MPHAGFDQFWAAYPRKVGKLAAQRAWQRHQPDLIATLSALEWQSQQPQWQKDGGQFVPHPATYINQGRWMDEPMQAIEKRRAPTFSEMKARRWVG